MVAGGRSGRAGHRQNLRANPIARVQLGRTRATYRACQASEAEVARYWPRFLTIWPAMETYYQRSGERWMFVDSGHYR